MTTIELMEGANYLHHTSTERDQLENMQDVEDMENAYEITLEEADIVNGSFAYNNITMTL